MGNLSAPPSRTLAEIEEDMDAARDARDIDRLMTLTREHAAMTEKNRERRALSPNLTYSTAVGYKSDLIKSRSIPVEKALSPARAVKAVEQAPHADGDHFPVTWSDDFRAMPNELLRAALFGVHTERTLLTNAIVASAKDTVVRYTGEELSINDEDVLLQVYHFQQKHALGTTWEVTGSEFLAALGRSKGDDRYIELYASLHRLFDSKVSITRAGSTRGDINCDFSQLISHLNVTIPESGKFGSGKRMIQITLIPPTLELWRSLGYTLISQAQRKALRGDMAVGLHRYYSTHRDPYPHKLEWVRAYLRTKPSTSKTKFRQLLKRALQSLVDIRFLSSFWIDSDDLVHVRRDHSDPPSCTPNLLGSPKS